jgi:hypothetical protein
MSNWSLTEILRGLHDDIHGRLEIVRKTLEHPGTKGDASEEVWLSLLNQYLPSRYRAEKAFVVDSKGNFSEQLDVVIFDRQYSPLIFKYQSATIIPAESVYAVFEAKQIVDADKIAYAQKKISSVRALHRTSLPIPHAGGVHDAKPPGHIFGGILAFESAWKPPLGESLEKALGANFGCLDLGCVAAHGYFFMEENCTEGINKKAYSIHTTDKPATSFLFKLIASLQTLATVPMMDVLAYSDWLTHETGQENQTTEI